MIQKILKILSIFILFFALASSIAKADELAEIEKQISDLSSALKMSQAATSPLENNLGKLQENLKSIQARIASVEKGIQVKQAEVAEGEELLIFAEELLGEKVRQLYKSSAQFGPYRFLLFFHDNLAESLRKFSYQRAVIEGDRDTIVKVVMYIKDLENKKQALEGEKVRLASVKEETDKQAEFLEKEITGAKKYQAELSKKIVELTARQQSIISQRQASLGLPQSLGAGPLYCTDDRERNPGFSNALAFFTYGIPHRVGMNQYGAYGRAKAGQNYEEILRAYFNGINFEKKENIKIKVQGYGEKDLEEYLLGIYEMPESWPIEALKAQVVAARSYALAYTNNGEGEICTTQACQVYKGGNKGGQWEQAVKDTKGIVMTHSGEMVKAWYSSTDGGYTHTSGEVWGSNKGWTKNLRDTTGDVGSFSDLNDKAYDKDSPCFYAAQGWRDEYDKSAWLKPSEVADIANALMLFKADGGTAEHLYQTDKSHPYGGEVWDEDKVKQELRNRNITPFNNVNSVAVSADFGSGRTTSISLSGDGLSKSFDAGEFKNVFNLRAPANIQIVGPLYNVEKK